MNYGREKYFMTFEENIQNKLIPDLWYVVRVDGRAFHTYTKKYEKPFDFKLHNIMVKITTKLMEELNADFGYTQSDEISILLRKDTDFFNKREQKIITVISSLTSSIFTHLTNDIVAFDGRIMPFTTEKVVDYFLWRMDDAVRNGLNSWVYWTLRKKYSGLRINSILSGKNFSEKNEILFEHEINFNEIEEWQRRGTSLFWLKTMKDGFNPITKENVKTIRRTVSSFIPLKSEEKYKEYLTTLLKEKEECD